MEHKYNKVNNSGNVAFTFGEVCTRFEGWFMPVERASIPSRPARVRIGGGLAISDDARPVRCVVKDLMAALSWSDIGVRICDNVNSPVQREILDALPALIFLERGGRIIFANAEAREVTGLAEVEWVQRPTEDLLWGLFPGTAEPQTALTGTRRGNPFHATLACKGGRMVPVEGTYEILSAELREGIIVAQCSERERAQKPRLMEDVLASIPEAVAIVLGTNVLYINPAFTRMFGFTSDEVSGCDLRDYIVPETRQHEQAMLNRMLEEQGTARLESVRMTKDGELVDVAMQVAPLLVSGAKAGYVYTYRDIGERKQVEAKLQHDAMHDVLTGLPNRALFQDRLRSALNRRMRRRDQGCGVLFLDLDGFKAINDSLGHATGDALLVSVAQRLKAVLRPQDTAARLGGDEFAILAENMAEPADLETLAQRILLEMNRSFDLHGHRVEVQVSIGAAMANSDQDDTDVLIRDADFAMYRSKQTGGHRYEIFDRKMEADVSTQQERERALRHVLARREFEFWYQPFFRLATGQVEGFEALLRRRNPDGTVDSFRDLLPVAENTGLSISINRDTVEAAWRQLQAWEEAMPGNGLSLTVNVTHRQFYHENMVAHLQTVLQNGGADPSRLMFEISESTVNDNPDRALVTIQRLVDCGVRVSIDNFGSILAPLHHLVRMPIDLVKLDPKLTEAAPRSTRHLAMLEALLHVAKSTGIRTLAQGIETHEQFQFVYEMGCELGQGHLLSLPLEGCRAQALAVRSRGVAESN